MVAGDGSGNSVIISEKQTSLKHQVWEGNLKNYSISGNVITLTTEINASSLSKDFTIREYGLLDNENNLIAVVSCNDIPVDIDNGIVSYIELSMRIEIKNIESISFENIDIKDSNVIYVATTSSPHKDCARFICNGINDAEVINQAIAASVNGDTLHLLSGSYNIYNPIIINKQITLKGSGWGTVLQQMETSEGLGETREVIIIDSSRVNIEDMMICDVNISSPVSPVIIHRGSYAFDNVFFIFKASSTDNSSSCVEVMPYTDADGNVHNDTSFGRIQNCRVFKEFNEDKVMFDLSKCDVRDSVISGNMSSGAGNISVKFSSQEQAESCSVFGHKNIDIKV